MGNEALHRLPKGTKQELKVDLQKFTGEKALAMKAWSESEKYKVKIGGYRGTSG